MHNGQEHNGGPDFHKFWYRHDDFFLVLDSLAANCILGNLSDIHHKSIPIPTRFRIKNTPHLITMKKLFLILFTIALITPASQAEWIDPLNESPAQRNARMQWWRDAKFGLFIHWGVYSVPAGTYKGEQIQGIGEWIMRNAEIPVEEYKAFANEFNPVNYDPDAWVRLAKRAGMKYLVITSKHHDGFALYDSRVTNWDIADATPYGKDLLKPLEEACIRHGIKLGFYYSQAQDWVHPGGGKARLEEGDGWDPAHKGDFDRYLHEIAYPQVKEILSNYELDILWWDTPVWMNRERADLLRRLIKLRPGLITNNRLGGDYTGDLTTPEQKVPATGLDYDWESCMTMNRTWGYKSYDDDWKSTETLIHTLIDIVSKGGNFLLNVGPTSLGEIPQPSIERLEAVGRWMEKNSDSIYGTTASPFRKLTWGRCTQKEGKLFLHVLDWPGEGFITVPGLKNEIKKAYTLAGKEKIKARHNGSEWYLHLPYEIKDPYATVIVLEIEGEPQVDPSYPTNDWNGVIQLNPDMSDIEQHGYGDKMEIVSGKDVPFIRNWNTHRAHVAWEFLNNNGGNFQIVAKIRSQDPLAGQIQLQASINDNRIKPADLGTLQLGTWNYITLGQVAIPNGVNTIILTRRAMGEQYPALDIENIKLIPLK